MPTSTPERADWRQSTRQPHWIVRHLGVMLWPLFGVLAIGWFAWPKSDSAKGWAPKGPPCPIVTAARAFPPGTTPTFAFEFHGVTFTRRSGQVTCEAVPDPNFLV